MLQVKKQTNLQWYWNLVNHTEILKICKDIDLKNINQFVIIGMYRTPHPTITKAHLF